MGVSLRSTSLKLPFEIFGFDAERPANSDVVSACAMSMASLASEGKKSLANATAVESNIYFFEGLSIKKSHINTVNQLNIRI